MAGCWYHSFCQRFELPKRKRKPILLSKNVSIDLKHMHICQATQRASHFCNLFMNSSNSICASISQKLYTNTLTQSFTYHMTVKLNEIYIPETAPQFRSPIFREITKKLHGGATKNPACSIVSRGINKETVLKNIKSLVNVGASVESLVNVGACCLLSLYIRGGARININSRKASFSVSKWNIVLILPSQNSEAPIFMTA